MASTTDGASHRAEQREDHADHQHQDANTPQDCELGKEGGDDQQSNAENNHEETSPLEFQFPSERRPAGEDPLQNQPPGG